MRQRFISTLLMAVVISMFTVPYAKAFEVTEIIPANRTEVETLSTITLKLDKPLGEWQPDPYALKIGNAPLTYDAIIHTEDGEDEIVITIEPELDIPGTYEIVIPRESIWDENYEYLPEVTLIYAVANNTTPPEDLVQYDMTYTSITPEAGRVETPIRNIVLEFDQEIFVKPETEEQYVRGRMYDDNNMVICNGRLEKTADTTVSVKLSDTVSKKGKYTFVIEKGLIGDATWNEDNSKGHANKEIRVEYNHLGVTSADTIDTDSLTVRTYGDAIVINGLTSGMHVEVYSISGSLVYNNVAVSSQTVIDSLSQGVYVLKTGNLVQKVTIK